MHKLSPCLQRCGPALAVMLAIFLFSSIPAVDVALARDTLIARVMAAVAQVFPSAQPLVVNWLKVGHALGYALLGATYLNAIGPARKWAGSWAVLGAAFYALTDEFHQMFVPGRGAGLNDVLIDTASAAAMVLVIEIVRTVPDYRARFRKMRRRIRRR